MCLRLSSRIVDGRADYVKGKPILPTAKSGRRRRGCVLSAMLLLSLLTRNHRRLSADVRSQCVLRQRRGERLLCRLTSTGCPRYGYPNDLLARLWWAACGCKMCGADHLRADLAFGNFICGRRSIRCCLYGAAAGALWRLWARWRRRQAAWWTHALRNSQRRIRACRGPSGRLCARTNRHLHRLGNRVSVVCW